MTVFELGTAYDQYWRECGELSLGLPDLPTEVRIMHYQAGDVVMLMEFWNRA